MRVLFVSDHFSTPQEPGILRTWQLARHLCEAGDDVTVVAPGTHYLFSEPPDTTATEDLHPNLTLVRIQTPALQRQSVGSRLRYYAAQLVAATREAWERPADVIVAGLTPSVLSIGPFLAARARRIPFVVDERDLSLDAAAELALLPRPAITAARVVERRLHRSADAVVAVTPGLLRMLAARGVPRDRLWLVPNGYEALAEQPSTTPSDIRRAWGWDDKVVLLYAGGLGQAYDLDIVLDALEELGVDDLVFAVMGEGERKASYEQRARARGLPVVFLPTTAKREVPAFCAAADICILPLRPVPWSVCSLSNKLFDYLGAGTPVIATGPGDTADLISTADAGLVVPAGDGHAMAAAIKELANDPERRERMGTAGQSYVSEQWRRERFTEDFRRALLSVVPGSAARRERELDRIRRVYAGYDGSAKEQAKRDLANRGVDAMATYRWQTIANRLRTIDIPDRPRILDVACGTGVDLDRIGELLRDRSPDLFGIDLLPDRIAAAQQLLPDATLIVGSADDLPFPDEHFDVVLVSTLFSSISDRGLARAIASEMLRTVRPSGVIVCYDTRLPNPRNKNTHAVSRRQLHDLFGGASVSVQSTTVMPPLARRLGRLAPTAYPLLHAVPPLRSHHLTVIYPRAA